MSKFFIRRPIVAIVIAIVTVILGVVSLASLPTSQYPDIVPPEIMVQATYPGADAKTLAVKEVPRKVPSAGASCVLLSLGRRHRGRASRAFLPDRLAIRSQSRLRSDSAVSWARYWTRPRDQIVPERICCRPEAGSLAR